MPRKRMFLAGSAVLAVAALTAGWFVFRYIARESPPEIAPPAPNQDEVIVLPDALDRNKKAVPSQNILVSEEKQKEAKRARLTGYICDEKLSGGTLRGVCYVPSDKEVELYPPMPLELKGTNAIQDPRPGEVAYFQNRPPLTPVWLGPYFKEKKRYGVRGALIVVKGMAAGKVPKFDSINFLLDYRSHELVAQKPSGENVQNPSWFSIGVAPPGNLIRIVNLTLYDSDLVIRRADTGNVLETTPLKGYSDKRYPGVHFGAKPDMADPPTAEIPRIREPGLYAIACPRHPWQKAYLCVPDSPYVALSEAESRDAGRTGGFVIPGVPPGKYTVEIWHPECEPVAKTYEVEILPDAETELAVEFKPPAALTQAPVTYPSKPITEWAFLGPVEPADEAVDAEVKKADFGATYNGKYDHVSWEKVSLPKSGDARYLGLFNLKGRWEPRVEGAAYLATRLDSPVAQRLILRVWASWLHLQVLLNGKSLFYTVDPREFAYGNEVIVAGDLKPGENILLVRVMGPAGDDTFNPPSGLRVSCLPEGLEPKAPEITAGAVAERADKSSLILTDSTYWRTLITRGPLRLNPRLLKDEQFLATRSELNLKRIELQTKALNIARNVDWTKTDWRDRALWFPHGVYQSAEMMSMLDQTPPPKNWMNPDFNDSEWMTLWNTRTGEAQLMYGTLAWNWYMRTDFTVPDGIQPGDLALKMTYHGGARVFVNGVEVARGHLPPGELAPEAAAEEYPEDAYMARVEELPNSPVPRSAPDLRTTFMEGIKDNNRNLESFRQPASPGIKFFLTREGWDRIRTARDRKLESVIIPAKLLRKGRNVLAVEIRGSLHHPDIWGNRGSRDWHLHWEWYEGPTGNAWAHAELLDLELRDPSGAMPSAMAPKKGLQVWAGDTQARVLDIHARPAATPVGTVRMVGALNGTFSGMVVVRNDGEIADLKAVLSDLKADGRPGTIGAGACKVTGMVARPLRDLDWLVFGGREVYFEGRYLRDVVAQASQSPLVPKRQKAEDAGTWFGKVKDRVQFYDDIGQTIPERVPANTAQPLWLSLKVPMETEPGVYKGTLTIQAKGQDNVAVPVEVEVIGWRVPNPQEFKTDVWLEQHPYAIANHYLLPRNAEFKPGERNWEGPVKAKVPLWSDEHFKLLEASFQQMARAGNDLLHIPVVNRTEFGNWQDSMVRWIRKKDTSTSLSAGGTFAFDYTILDRYLDMAVKYLGRVRVIDFVIMHCTMGQAEKTSVMVYDEASGKTEEMNVGPKADVFQRLSVWKTFVGSLLRHMKEKGWEQGVYWGHAGDYEPDPGLMSYLVEFFPGTYWSGSGHSYNGGAGGGGHSRNIMRCFSDVYGAPKPLQSVMGWKGPTIANELYVFNPESKAGNFTTRRADETYLYIHNPRDWCMGHTQPIKWRAYPAMALHNGYSGIGRCGLDGYEGDWMSGTPGMDWGFPGRPCNMLTWPGPQGAESSARFEALLEGLQETEARTFLEQTLDRGHVSTEVAGEAQRALDDHMRPFTMVLAFRDGIGDEYIYPWQSCSRLLFKTAAKVAEIVGVDINTPDIALHVPALGQAARDFKIRNWTGKPREWKAVASAPWIVLPRTGGKLMGFEDFAFTLDGRNLKTGETVKGNIVITDTASGHASTFEITATVESPVIVTYDHPHFNMACGRSETREFRVANRAVTPQDWQLSAPVPWFKIEPSSGTLKPGEERTITLTAAPPDQQAKAYANEFTLKAAGGLGDGKFISKTFVIPLLREKEDRAMPPGRILKIEDLGKQFKSAVYCKNGTIIDTGLGVHNVGVARTKQVDFRGLFAPPNLWMGGNWAGFLPLVGKEKFSRALWVLPHAEVVFNLEGAGITGFSAYVGVSKDAQRLLIQHPNYRVNFEVYVDGEVRTQSGLMLTTDDPRYLTLENLKGAREVKLVTRLDCDKDDPTFSSIWADVNFYAEREATATKAEEKK